MSSNSSSQSAGVGLSDPVRAARRRQMIDIVNNLRLTGVQKDLDLPVIAVIGFQSAGKSSLIESISGVTLPRATGTCTRCPTEVQLTHSPDSWKCTVHLRIQTDNSGKKLGHSLNHKFGDTIYSVDEVEDRVRRAQRAILTPSTDYHVFLEGDEPEHPSRELLFSENAILLQISGSDVQDLSFCDLPGVIANVGNGGNGADVDLIKSLISSYIEKPGCIILSTVSCETDIENQGAHALAQKFDPDGIRTIGVLTKPDRSSVGAEDSWVRFIKNEKELLKLGWFSVKQPDSRAIDAGITWAEAREQERGFFLNTPPWNELAPAHRNRLGTDNLVERLSNVLADAIEARLPSFQEELQRLLAETDSELAELPKPPSSDAVSEVLDLLNAFSRSLGQHIEGTPDANGLLQSIRPSCEAFCKAIRATEPDFRPYERSWALRHPSHIEFRAPAFLADEGDPYAPADNSGTIFIDEVLKRAQEAITRELPDHYPFVVIQKYIAAIIYEWKTPSELLTSEVHDILATHIRELVSSHFKRYPVLKARVILIVTDFIKTEYAKALERIKWFIDVEIRPRTLNEAYYRQYRNKFLAHYKGWRPKVHRDTPVYLVSSPTDPVILLPQDPCDEAMKIMASVRAYFQVAHKRFVDNIPMAIDYDLVLGLGRGQTLEKVLREGLGIVGKKDSLAQCADYIKEPRHIAARREELMKKRERLEMARTQLAALILW